METELDVLELEALLSVGTFEDERDREDAASFAAGYDLYTQWKQSNSSLAFEEWITTVITD